MPEILKLYLKVIVTALVVGWLIRAFLVESYRIPTSSMQPTLLEGDVVIGIKWPYEIQKRPPRYGETVVYSPPNMPTSYFLKRVIGLPGDVVEFQRGVLFFNNKAVKFEAPEKSGDDPKCGKELHPENAYSICRDERVIPDFGPAEVAPGQVFLVSDFRTSGGNRTAFEMVPQSSLSSKIVMTFFSIDTNQGVSLSNRIRWDRLFLWL